LPGSPSSDNSWQMSVRRQVTLAPPIALTSAAAFAIACLVAATALVGLLLSRQHVYEPHTGLVCPNDGWVDFSKLVGPAANWKPQNPEDLGDLHKFRQGFALRPLGDASAVRVWVLGTMMPSQSKITALQSSSGLWTVHLDHEAGYPANQESHSEITLTRTQGDEFERMLKDPCLYAEPQVIGNEFPTANGKSGYCFDGATTVVDIYFNGRRRSAVQACNTYGLTGSLVEFLRNPFKRPAS